MYDFVLFENFYLALNHYKDVCIIAKMLQKCGYTVAIADVFGEAEHCQIEGVPHITFKKQCPVTIDYGSHNRGIIALIKNAIDRKRIDGYLKYVMRELRGKYRHLYAGSYFVHMTTGWLKEIPEESSAFFWGLRSSRLVEFKLNRFHLKSYDAYKLHRYFERHQNLKYFVSDEIIRQEFLNLGVAPNRLVLRPERIIEQLPQISSPNKENKSLCLLSIGSLRETKRIEKILDALRDVNSMDIHYVIAGKADASYEAIIDSHRKGLDNVERRNYRLSEEEYNTLLDQCDFLVLCDSRQLSSVTNGTMNEALLKGKPIIAPNYNPYRFFIEKYGIGIMFDPEEKHSLSDAIRSAQTMSAVAFEDAIHEYQGTLLMEKIIAQFSKELKLTLA